MSVPIINRPAGVDVTKRNALNVIYIGNIFEGQTAAENIDGSIRIRVPVPGGPAQIELRETGIWNVTDFEFSDDTVLLGKDGSIGWSAGFIETKSNSSPTGHNTALIPHVEFDDFGTKGTHSPQLNTVHPLVFFDNPTSETTSTVLGQIIFSASAMMIENGRWEVGTTGASEMVTLKYFTGSDNTGTLFFEKNFPASQFLANQQVSIEFNDSFGFDEGGTFFQEFTSDVAFSLQINASGDIVTEFDTHDLFEVGMLTTDLLLDTSLDLVFNNDLDVLQVGVPSFSTTLMAA